MSLPAIRALKAFFPDSAIELITCHHCADVFTGIQEIDRILHLSDPLRAGRILKNAGLIRNRAFDCGILLTNSFSSALLFKLAGVSNTVGYNRDKRGALLKKKMKFVANDHHHSRYYLDLIAFFAEKKSTGIYSDKLVISDHETGPVKDLLRSAGIRRMGLWIGLSPSSAYGTAKEWRPEYYKRLISKIIAHWPGATVLLFGSSSEKEKIQAVIPERSAGVVNLAGRLSLRQTILAMSFCRAFISNDSGLMHVASSMRIPLVALFGPTVPQKTAPLSPLSTVVHQPVDCWPCTHRICPLDHRCMKNIAVETVFSALQERLTLNP